MSMPSHPGNPALITLARTLSHAAQTLQLWRKEAGAKSKWSSHQRLKEQALFNAAEAACQEITEALQPRFPDHWSLSNWSLRCLRMGNEIRWCPRNSSRDGGTFGNELHQILTALGYLLGLAEKVDCPSSHHIERQKELGLSLSEMHAFRVDYTRDTIKGYTIHDAYAAHSAKKRPSLYIQNAALLEPEEILEKAWCAGAAERSKPQLWSAMPTLEKRLAKIPLAKRLFERPLKVNPIKPYIVCDRHVAAAIALLSGASGGSQEPQPFMILSPGDFGNGALGWCGKTAVASRIINLIQEGTMPSHVDAWKVYAIADECGEEARKAGQTYRLDEEMAA